LQLCSPEFLEDFAPFAKLLLRAVQALMQQPEYVYDGPAYRWVIAGLQFGVECWWFTGFTARVRVFALMLLEQMP
jgi:hypothetical protein